MVDDIPIFIEEEDINDPNYYLHLNIRSTKLRIESILIRLAEEQECLRKLELQLTNNTPTLKMKVVSI